MLHNNEKKKSSTLVVISRYASQSDRRAVTSRPPGRQSANQLTGTKTG